MTSTLSPAGDQLPAAEQRHGAGRAVQPDRRRRASRWPAPACSATPQPGLLAVRQADHSAKATSSSRSPTSAPCRVSCEHDQQHPGRLRRAGRARAAKRSESAVRRNQTAATAAVLLSGTSSLDPASVRGIAQLVSSSVPGLSCEGDDHRRLGSTAVADQDSGDGGGSGMSQRRRRAALRPEHAGEPRRDARAERRRRQGAGAQVNADMNVDQTTQESLTYGKAGVPLTQSNDTETLAGNGSGGGGAAGTANIPAYAQTAAGGKSNYKHVISNTTLGVDKTVTHTKVAPGKVEQPARLGAARQLRAGCLGGRRAIASGHQRRRDPDQARRHALDRADRVRQAAGGSRRGGRDHRLRQVRGARHGLAAVPVLHYAHAAPPRAGGASTTSRSGCASCEAPVRLAELERETPPDRPRSWLRHRQRRRQPAAATRSAGRSSSWPTTTPTGSPSSCATGCRRTNGDRAARRRAVTAALPRAHRRTACPGGARQPC